MWLAGALLCMSGMSPPAAADEPEPDAGAASSVPSEVAVEVQSEVEVEVEVELQSEVVVAEGPDPAPPAPVFVRPTILGVDPTTLDLLTPPPASPPWGVPRLYGGTASSCVDSAPGLALDPWCRVAVEGAWGPAAGTP